MCSVSHSVTHSFSLVWSRLVSLALVSLAGSLSPTLFLQQLGSLALCSVNCVGADLEHIQTMAAAAAAATELAAEAQCSLSLWLVISIKTS